jgi:hypothetical protein
MEDLHTGLAAHRTSRTFYRGVKRVLPLPDRAGSARVRQQATHLRPRRTRPRTTLVTTELTSSAEDLVARYAARWCIEVLATPARSSASARPATLRRSRRANVASTTAAAVSAAVAMAQPAAPAPYRPDAGACASSGAAHREVTVACAFHTHDGSES